MDSKHWYDILAQASLLDGEGNITPQPGTILTIHAADVEVALKDGSSDVTITRGDQIMTVTNHATGFVQYLPWDEVTKIEQRRTDDHRYRHGSS
jgi:hypothetical protein